MFLKILNKIVLRNFTINLTNSVLSFCFATRLFHQTNPNEKQTSLELRFLTGMSAVNPISSCSKKECKCRILAQQDKNHPALLLFKKQCGFRKGHSTQHYLLAMLKRQKRHTDSGKAFGALLIDLSETFDCLDQKLLIANVTMNSLLRLQLNYCLLIWMCHNCKNNKKINRLRESYLRTIHNDKQSSFYKLSEKDGSFSSFSY